VLVTAAKKLIMHYDVGQGVRY